MRKNIKTDGSKGIQYAYVLGPSCFIFWTIDPCDPSTTGYSGKRTCYKVLQGLYNGLQINNIS